MKNVRTIVWILLLVALLIFSTDNWKPAEVRISEDLALETKSPALVVSAFLLDRVPMSLLQIATRRATERRIASLESAARASAMAPAPPTPAASGPFDANPAPTEKVIPAP